MSLPNSFIASSKIFKHFFACKIVLAAKHQCPGNIRRIFCLQNCLSRKTSKSWKYSMTFLPAKLSWPQIISILEIFKDFFACETVLAANHQHPENIQRLFRLRAAFQPQLASSSNQKHPAVSQLQPAMFQQTVATISNQQ